MPICSSPRALRNAQLRSRAMRDALVATPFAFPGGYPLYAVTDDGQPLCHRCAKGEHSCIGFTTGSDGWCIVDLQANFEDPDLNCANCGAIIESAYG
jgi:hypothetical protein